MKTFIFVFVVFVIICDVFASRIERPDNKALGNPKFKPGPYPCPHTIYYIENSTDKKKMIDYNISGVESVYGRYLVYAKNDTRDSFETTRVMRAEIREEGNPREAAVFEIKKSVDSWECELIRWARTSSYEDVSDISFLVDDEWPYDYVEKGYWNGTPCDVYHLHYDSENAPRTWVLYVDERNYIIGYRFDSTGYTHQRSFTYSSDVNIKDFMIPMNSSGCSDYPTAYEHPSEHYGCNASSSESFSSGNSGSGTDSSVDSSNNRSLGSLIIIIICAACAALGLLILIFILICCCCMCKTRSNGQILSTSNVGYYSYKQMTTLS